MELDKDGDGVVDVSEVLAAADLDGDGKLDAHELQIIADRFNDQIKYSNKLLREIQGAEEKALEAQKDIQKKQAALREALAREDAAKEETAEYKKKLADQTVASMMMLNSIT